MDNNIKTAIREFLQSRSFSLKGELWLRGQEETVSVVQLQKSQFGEQYYVNLGVFIKTIGSVARPSRLEQCQIRVRLSGLIEESSNLAFDADSDLSEEQRHELIRNALQTGIVWLGTNSRLEDIKQHYNNGELRGAMVHRLAKELFVR
jgi:hypothetical protein